jgi:hypothetical protein
MYRCLDVGLLHDTGKVKHLPNVETRFLLSPGVSEFPFPL